MEKLLKELVAKGFVVTFEKLWKGQVKITVRLGEYSSEVHCPEAALEGGLRLIADEPNLVIVKGLLSDDPQSSKSPQ